MKLLGARLEGVRDIADMDLVCFRTDPLVITGEPGCGKTTVLEAILAARSAFLPGGRTPPADAWTGDRAGPAFVELHCELSDTEQQRAKIDSRYFRARWNLRGPSADLPIRLREVIGDHRVEYFDTRRSLAKGSGADRPRPDDPVRCRRGLTKYGWVERHLLDLARAEAASVVSRLEERGMAIATRDVGALEPFARALASLCPRLRWQGVGSEGGIEFARFARRNGTVGRLEELGDSEQMAVLMAASIDALALDGGLIVIDTPELHIHPREHASFFDALAKLVPNAQIIAATTSAGILRAHPVDHVFVMA